uniref:Putative secreted protein n=1 Tax=Ixodes ricinus TaxID=34613 RepID=A0A6B0UFI9_IXORI
MHSVVTHVILAAVDTVVADLCAFSCDLHRHHGIQQGLCRLHHGWIRGTVCIRFHALKVALKHCRRIGSFIRPRFCCLRGLRSCRFD